MNGQKQSDDLMKQLVAANIQQFLSWVLEGAHFERLRDKELKTRTVNADFLCDVTWNDEKMVLHVEFQKRRDKNMGRRMWEYNVMTDCEAHLPVYSIVIYLIKDKNIVESTYERKLPNGSVTHVFYFRTIKLWEVPSEIFKQPGLEGMLPLLPFTENGQRREVVEDVITGLKAAGKEDLFTIAYWLAGLIFNEDADKQWLRERFDKMHDIIEESWSYQEMVQGAVEKAVEKAVKETIEKTQLEEERLMLSRFVQKRFPELVRLARQQAVLIKDVETLRNVTDAIIDAQTADEVKQILLEATKSSDTSS